MVYLLAQFSLGSEEAVGTLNNAITLTKETATSWQRVWDATVSPQADLWKALIGVGILIAAIALLYMGIRQGKEIQEKGSWADLIEMLIPPLMVGLFLAGNGYLLSNSILLVRQVAYGKLTQVYDAQIDGLTLDAAVDALQQTNLANARVREIFADCIDKSGAALEACMADEAKLDEVEEAMEGFDKSLAGNLLDLLEGLLNPAATAVNIGGSVFEGLGEAKEIGQIISELFASPFIAIAQTLLYTLQWAFVNGVEAALLLTALMGPVALGLSIVPIAGRFVFAWFSGLLGLFAIQLGYAIIVGICAVVINFTASEGQTLTYLLSDLAFVVFAALISPDFSGSLRCLRSSRMFYHCREIRTSIIPFPVSKLVIALPIIAP